MIWYESSGPDAAESVNTCHVALLPVGCGGK
jgi:hypothetical protein